MDPYVYPGTSVLKNLRDIRDLNTLAAFEADATTRRLRQLEHSAKSANLTIAHLKTIHRHIFQDVHPWAGELCTVNIARPGQFYFAFTEQILPCLENLFAQLISDKAFHRNAQQSEFCGRAAYYMGEINAIHPFRDGNGRTQREFIRQLALNCGHRLNWSHTTRATMNAASQKSFREADSSCLAAILQWAIDPLTPEA